MKKIEMEYSEELNGGGWVRCALGIGGGFLAGFAGATGNGIALTLGPVGVTWGFLGGVGGAIVGGAGTCY